MGSKRQETSVLKDGEEVWSTQEELSSPNFRVQEIKLNLTSLGQGQRIVLPKKGSCRWPKEYSLDRLRVNQ